MILRNINEDEEKVQTLICTCGHYGHHLVFTTFPDTTYDIDDNVYIGIHLDNKSFWKRVVIGFKYIFGIKSTTGAYTELLCTKEELIEITKGL